MAKVQMVTVTVHKSERQVITTAPAVATQATSICMMGTLLDW
jgi:hypothetical protein